MTDREKLEKIREELPEREYFKRNVIDDLLLRIDKTTGMLTEAYSPQKYDRNDDFLWQTLSELGYSYSYTEEYNSYFECFCYRITLSRL